MDILSLAHSLALLTFTLGAALYGSPLPFRSVKRWGVLMMYDGLASALLVSIYNLISRLGDYMLSLLDVSWPQFMAWLIGRTSVLVTFYLVLQSIASSLKLVGADVLIEVLKHLGGLVATSLTALKVVYVISAVICGLRDKMIAAGILLYSLPLRVGKSVGAALIALSLVYFVGLPLMPAFAAIFETELPAVAGVEHGRIEGLATDAIGNAIPYPVVRLYSGGGEPVVIVVGDEGGRFYIGPPQDLLGSGKEFEAEILFMGYKFIPEPRAVITPWRGSLRVTNALYLGEGLSILFVGVVTLESVERINGTDVFLNISSTSPITVNFLKLDLVKVSRLLLNGEEVACGWDSFGWRGMTIEECRVELGPGSHVIGVSYFGVAYPKPVVEERHYTDYEDLLGYLSALQSTAASYVFSYLILPSAYLVVLSAASYALSKVLGGGVRLRLI